MYTFVCEKCGGTFQSKTDPSKWRNRLCNNCRGNKYATNPSSTYTPQHVPVQQPTGGVVYAGTASQPKKEFDIEARIADFLLIYQTFKRIIDESRLTIPEDNICQWTTSLIIEKNKRDN